MTIFPFQVFNNSDGLDLIWQRTFYIINEINSVNKIIIKKQYNFKEYHTSNPCSGLSKYV